MKQYSLIVCESVLRDQMEVEIQRNKQDGPPDEIARVYKSPGGWEIDYADNQFEDARDAEFEAAVERAVEGILGPLL